MSSSRGTASPTLRPSSPAHVSGRLHRVPSHEVLNAHPLLSPGLQASSNVSISTNIGPSPNNNSLLSPADSMNSASSHTSQPAAPKYLPYTPRQARVVTGSATTGTANSPVSVSPQHPGGGGAGSTAPSATSRLQLQNLKAVAQHHGLDTGCVGWAMLEELVAASTDHVHAHAWTEVWAVIATGKVRLDCLFGVSRSSPLSRGQMHFSSGLGENERS